MSVDAEFELFKELELAYYYLMNKWRDWPYRPHVGLSFNRIAIVRYCTSLFRQFKHIIGYNVPCNPILRLLSAVLLG